MATVRNKAGHEVGNKEGIYPTRSDKGSDLVEEVVDTVNIVQMGGLGLGILNGGATEITLDVILVGDHSTNPIPIVIPAYTQWSGGFFNAVSADGSTGQLFASTRYLYA
jgi:hypothetical protein